MFNLTFSNPGEIDIRGATVAGLSAKDSESAIGKFGTGLKYAIASILRWGGDITIYSGLTRHDFHAEEIDFRGKAHHQIHMTTFAADGIAKVTPLGFTTHYGDHWEPWQIFRELYSNVLDEHGDVGPGIGGPAAGFTTMNVACKELRMPWRDRDTIILPQLLSPLHEDYDVQVFDMPAEHVYYKGVRVHKSKCLFTYNLLDHLDLTEDRTLDYSWTAYNRIAHSVCTLDDTSKIYKILNAPRGYIESELEFGRYYSYSPEFIEVACRLFKSNPTKYSRLSGVVEKHQPEALEPAEVSLSPIRQQMLDKAITCVKQMGMHPDLYTIKVCELGPDTLGMYKKATGTIFLSPTVFDQGTKQVLSTLYEELVHGELGLEDCNYQMQTFLFNRIISLHEEHTFHEPI